MRTLVKACAWFAVGYALGASIGCATGRLYEQNTACRWGDPPPHREGPY